MARRLYLEYSLTAQAEQIGKAASAKLTKVAIEISKMPVTFFLVGSTYLSTGVASDLRTKFYTITFFRL